ncbi:MAG: hypothetical protein ACUVR3_01700, partial [Candidatus Roseilinea sp.]
PMWYDLPVQQPAIRDGFMYAPDGPGFGMPLRQDTIDRWRVSTISTPAGAARAATSDSVA